MVPEVLKLFAKMFLIITVLTTVFFYFLAIFLGPALFYFTPQGIDASIQHLPSLPVWFFTIIGFDIPIGLDYGVVFLFIWGVFTVSLVAAWKLRENFHRVIRESVVRPVKKLFSNCLFAMPLINSMTLITLLVVQSFQEVGGIPTGTAPLPGEPFLDFFELSYAAVIEEIGFRIIPIGAFLVAYLFWTKQKVVTLSFRQKLKLFVMAPLFPDRAKRMVGAKTVDEYGVRGGISLGEWGMVLFTSITFGLAHFLLGGGWEIGKTTSAALAGLVLGLSYLVYGVQASIIIHWFFNAYMNTYVLFSEIYPIATPLANAVVIFTVILGILGWAAIVILGYFKLIRAITEKGENKEDQATSNLPISLQ
ncbi:MAG: CPBP family intramembrane metalloprotease [Candidatus Bathyarchaeum sp.]|nr:MAG: CPBP family intramembrane metalloprotease [Candidatus Bathyarchaeum sp.]